LISRGHGLVADDAVDFARLGPDYIEGRCPVILRNLLEVRGLGLLDIRTIFGETAVRRKLKLRLIVQLVRRTDGEFERLPLEAQHIDVLGIPIRTVKIQVAAGRNLAVLVEAAVRNTILQLRGIDTLKDLYERQILQLNSEADLVFDVRCLPNPHYDKILRPLTGNDKPVKEFLEKIPEVVNMEADITQFIHRWLPHYIADGRSYLTVAIGCTGGQHRSVYLVNRLSEYFRGQKDFSNLQLNFLNRHRELDSIPAAIS
jgi:hypothetical protein